MTIDRRSVAKGLGALGLGAALGGPALAAPYRGPKVIVIRFGGGVRRRETIEAATTHAPHLVHDLIPQGALIPDLRIAALDGVDTSHAEGTLNLLTGRYLAYRRVEGAGLGDRLQPTAPTLFEYFRKRFDAPAHHALLINGEDRLQEEFFSFGAHRHFGVAFRSETLSAYRFRRWSLEKQLAVFDGPENEYLDMKRGLEDLQARDPRGAQAPEPSAAMNRFWERWAERYGLDGRAQPRGDRLLTELAIRALAELKPRLMMVNYQDPDYVHWGVASHYTRAIQVIDDGVRRIREAATRDPEYRDDTVFLITPDCGRDANALMDVPFQHHFNSRSAHEVWALALGPGVASGAVIDGVHDQSQAAATVAALMGFQAGEAEGAPLERLFA